jgi:hypothetical protein
LAIGFGGGMKIVPSYQLENQAQEQSMNLDLFISPSIGLHYGILELALEYRKSHKNGDYTLLDFKIIY